MIATLRQAIMLIVNVLYYFLCAIRLQSFAWEDNHYHIADVLPQVLLFRNGEPLALAKSFPNLEIPEPGFPNKISDRLPMKFYGSFVLRAIALHMHLSISLQLARDVYPPSSWTPVNYTNLSH